MRLAPFVLIFSLLASVGHVQAGTCTDGTENDPAVELPPPTIPAPQLVSSDYILKVFASKLFNDLAVNFDSSASNPCNYDSLVGDANGWVTTDDPTDPNCVYLRTMTKPAQDMLATCGFSPDTSESGFVTYRRVVNVVSNQTLSIDSNGLRAQNFSQIKTTHFTLGIRIPTTISASSGEVNVTGNISTLAAISALEVDVATIPYTVAFQLILSSQSPYQLTYQSFTPSVHLENKAPDVADVNCTAGPDNSCTQFFTWSGVDILTSCTTKTFLNDQISVTWSVGCIDTFSGGCNPVPNTVTATFSLISTGYCPQISTGNLDATMKLYRDVQLDNSIWQSPSRSSQFVIGTNVYGEIDVSVDNSIASIQSSTISALRTTSYLDEVIVVHPGGLGGTVTDDGDVTQFPGHRSKTRFAVPMVNGVTVKLNPTDESAQAVVISAVVDVTFTVEELSQSSRARRLSSALRHWDTASKTQSKRIIVRERLQTPSLQDDVTSGTSSQSSFILKGNIEGNPNTIVVPFFAWASFALLIVSLVLYGAYRAGIRASQDEAPQVPVTGAAGGLVKSPSSVAMLPDVVYAEDSGRVEMEMITEANGATRAASNASDSVCDNESEYSYTTNSTNEDDSPEQQHSVTLDLTNLYDLAKHYENHANSNM